MECSKKRTKSNNFTADEKRILTEMVLKYQPIIENKRTDATTNKDKLNGWIRLAQEFNSISTYCYRTNSVLKCCWENIKRQAKKEHADTKKKIFMTGGGPPSPSPSSSQTGAIIEAILGPALTGMPNIYDSNAITNETIGVDHPTDIDGRDFLEVVQILEDDISCNIESSQEINDEKVVVQEDKNNINSVDIYKSTPKGILRESNVNDSWSSWNPKCLKMPVSEALKEGEKLKRRRPVNDCPTDILVQEKIKLVKMLQENAHRESLIRYAILEEQLKQEKLKTEKLAFQK